MSKRWTQEEDAILFAHYATSNYEQMQALLPERSMRSIYHRAYDIHGISKNPDTLRAIKTANLSKTKNSQRFAPGHTPWNKGMPHPWGKKTQFKAGNIPPTHKPVGTEKWIKNVLLRKVSDYRGPGSRSRNWRPVHQLIWEEAHGPIPKGHVVHFLDGDPRNITLSNLACIPRGVLAYMCKHDLHGMRNADLARSAIALAKLELMRNKRSPRRPKRET